MERVRVGEFVGLGGLEGRTRFNKERRGREREAQEVGCRVGVVVKTGRLVIVVVVVVRVVKGLVMVFVLCPGCCSSW